MKDKLKNIILYLIIIVVLIVAIVGTINHFNNDGMSQTKGISIYYKTYTEEYGWSKWSENGVTSGDSQHPIKNIKIRVKTKENGKVVYKVYSNGKWSSDLNEELQTSNNSINAVKFATTNIIYRKYNICYRTYNKEDKWLEWTCNGNISGNSNKNVSAIEIKIIPRNVIKNEWLKDYNKTLKKTKIGF